MKTGKQNLKEGTDDWAPHISESPAPSALPCPARTAAAAFSRRRGGAAPPPGWPGSGGALGIGAGPRAGAARGGAGHPRRRGGGPATAARDLSGEEDWEHQSGMGMLTEGLVCAKEGRKWFVDGRAELR